MYIFLSVTRHFLGLSEKAIILFLFDLFCL